MKKIASYLKKHWQLVLNIVYVVVVCTVYVIAAAKGLPHLLRFGMLLIFVLVFGVALIDLLFRTLRTSNKQVTDRAVLSRVIFDGIDKSDSPCVLCRADGRIAWCNEAMIELLSEKRKPYGRTLGEVFGITTDEVRSASKSDGVGLEFANSYYIVKYTPVKFERASGLVTFTESKDLQSMRDELALIHTRLDDTSPIVAYLYVDNLSEIMKSDSTMYRSAIMKTDEIVRNWAEQYNAVVNEYEKERYLLVFEKRALRANIEKNFDILDKMRDIRVGTEQLSVTASIGISDIYGDFAAKEKAARSALELALSRGGDQVAIKTDEGEPKFYGGRNKSSRKRSSVRSRVVANELIMHISRSSNVIIMGHKYSDYDSIGSAVGLARLAMFCGVPVNIVVDKNDDVVKLCTAFVKDIAEYRNVFISSDEAFDRMQTETIVILSDVNNLKIVEDRALVESAPRFAVIDHHRKQQEYVDDPLLEYIEPKASSAGELVCEMLETILPKDMLTPAEANLLLSGIMLDTKQFSRMTGTRTYGAALYLHDCGAEPQAVQEFFKSDIEEYRREALFRSNVVIYRDNIAITLCENEGGGAADKIMASKAAEGLITIRGIKAAFAIVMVEDIMHISARSTGEVNVQLILAKLGGGGHFDTAGAQVKGVDANTAAEMLKGAIDEYLDEN